MKNRPGGRDKQVHLMSLRNHLFNDININFVLLVLDAGLAPIDSSGDLSELGLKHLFFLEEFRAGQTFWLNFFPVIAPCNSRASVAFICM